MKLMHPFLSTPICFHENCIPVLIIENAVSFRNLVTELVRQSEGQDGDFVLSYNDHCLDCAGHVNVFLDFIHLQELEKRTQTKVLAALLHNTREELAKDTFQLSQMIQHYLGKLAMLADYPVAFDQSENINALLKAMEFHVDLSSIPPCEALYEQMSLLNSVVKNQCFILVNAKAYFSTEELHQLYQMAFYKKLHLMLIESRALQALPCEELRLYDKDLCELKLDSSSDIM